MNVLAAIVRYIRIVFVDIGRFFVALFNWIADSIPEGGTVDRLLHVKIPHFCFFPVVIVYYEIILRLFTKTPFFQNLFYPIVFGLSFGFLLSGVTSLFRKRVNWWISIIALLVVPFYYGLEAVLRNTYQVFMTLSSITTEAGHAVGGFGSDVRHGVLGAIPVIIVYYIPLILYLIRARQQMPAEQYRPLFGIMMFAVFLLLWGFGTLFAAHMPNTRDKYTGKFEFDTATRTFGLATSTRLNLRYSTFGNKAAESFVVTPQTTEENELEEPAETEADAAETTANGDLYGYNVMDIDFDELIAETSDPSIKEIHEYVNSLEPSAKNEYTGLFEGKNLITIVAEAFSMQVINEELTPMLYRMSTEGINFTDFYQPAWGGSTTTGEYSVLTGLVPTDSVDTMLDTIGDNMYFTTGNQLQRLGYTSVSFHNGFYDYYDRDQTHLNLGYDSYLGWGNGLEDLLEEWSEDEATFEATMPTYIDKQPFNAYYMTFSGHCTYDADDSKVEKNLPRVKEVLGDEYEDKTLYYFCYQLELEYALESMVEILEEAGIADDTVIVVCPDHFPYGLGESSTFGNSEDYLLDLYKVDSYDGYVRDRTSLIIWSESIEGMGPEVDTPTSSVDILPTISNLFGLEYDSRLLVGRDVFSDELPLVEWADHSFLTEKGWYNADTGVFLPTTDEEITDEYLENIKTIVANKVAFSGAVPKYDYYGILFGEDDVQ